MVMACMPYTHVSLLSAAGHQHVICFVSLTRTPLQGSASIILSAAQLLNRQGHGAVYACLPVDATRQPCSQYSLSHFSSRSAPGHRLMHARRDRPLQVRIPPVLQLGCQPRHVLMMGHNLQAT